ncbi:MAG: DUF4271 domain-containing protein [Crocinitomicaceae bacterium]|nr:DUF4271 domain-containing protein [Crocinitomicaceae bacterium]
MIFTELFTSPLIAIPTELSLRDNSISPIVGAGLFISFLMIAFAKLLKSDIYLTLVISNIKIAGLPTYLREAFPLNKGGSYLLLVNYLLSFSTIIYLLYGAVEIGYQEWINIATIPLVILLWSLGSMLIVGLISGDQQAFYEPISMKIIGAQLLGIIYFVIALISVLYAVDNWVLIQLVIWTFFAEYFIRLAKSIIIVYLKGVSWYYIILYFCTLEILPLFVAYYLLLRDFGW